MSIRGEVFFALPSICWNNQWFNCSAQVLEVICLPCNLALICYNPNDLAYIVADIWAIRVAKRRLEPLSSLSDRGFVRVGDS